MLKRLRILFPIILFTLLYSCSPNRYVPKGQYIIDDVKIKVDNPKIKASKLSNITETQELKKILNIYALRSRLYYIPNPKKEKQRIQKKKDKLEKKNKKITHKFSKQNAKLAKKRNIYYNRVQDYKDNNDTLNKKYIKTVRKFEDYKTNYNYRSTHSSDILEEKKKDNVFILADFWHNIGQKPQILNTYLIDITTERYRTYLMNEGYFRPVISYDIDTINKKRVRITYNVKTGEPLKIGSISYKLPNDTQFKNFFTEMKIENKIKPGKELNIDQLDKYRNNIVTYYRNRGYYFFNNQIISFDIDTNGRYSHSALTLVFKTDVDPKVYKQWYIKDISIFNDFSPSMAMQDTSYSKNVNIEQYPEENPEFNYIKKHRVIIKPKYLSKELYLKKDSLYTLRNTQYTYSHLSKFDIYKLTNIEFEEVPESDSLNYLNCQINLTPDNITDLVFEAEATNTSLNNGGAANISFIHKNLFKGGEVLNLQLKLALQKQKTFDSTSNNLFNTQEYSFDIKLTIPRLLSPLKGSEFIRRNNPRTIINTSFSYQNRPEYNKVTGQLTMDYLMKSSKNSSFIVTPIRFSSIRVFYIAPDFQDLINKTSLAESYADHFIFGSKLTYLNTNQGDAGFNYYFQLNIIPAGNLLNTITSNFADTVEGGYYNFPGLETPYAQFFKADFDARIYLKSNNKQTTVFRLFTGVGYPYGNSHIMPFSEKYFVGGANSIRGWQARTLGPGEYQIPNGYLYVNQLGDIKIETNFEYRYPIISVLEGAFFLDAGNIWDINTTNKDKSGLFHFNKFYKQFAVSIGTGVRLNLSYFVIRLDLGIKMVDPKLPEGRRFIPFERSFYLNDFNYNIAIGYPF